MSIGSDEVGWRRDFAEVTGNRLTRLEAALVNSSQAMGQLHSLVERVHLTGGTNTQKLAEGLNKALADQQGGVLQIQAQTDLRHAETVQQLQALLQEGEKKQREEALKLQAFLSEGEQRRQTQLEGGFTQIAQVAAGLREQNLLFQQQTQQALENVSRKILEVENLAREASTRVPALNAEHLAHMPDPAAHAAALANMAEALQGLDRRLDQRFGTWEKNFRDLSASSTQLSQTLGDVQAQTRRRGGAVGPGRPHSRFGPGCPAFGGKICFPRGTFFPNPASFATGTHQPPQWTLKPGARFCTWWTPSMSWANGLRKLPKRSMTSVFL